MSQRWTPFIMSVVLHHYVSPVAFERCDLPLYKETAERLVRDGVLVWDEEIHTYVTTALGQALIGCWLSQPLPVAMYVDPRLKSLASMAPANGEAA